MKRIAYLINNAATHVNYKSNTNLEGTSSERQLRQFLTALHGAVPRTTCQIIESKSHWKSQIAYHYRNPDFGRKTRYML